MKKRKYITIYDIFLGKTAFYSSDNLEDLQAVADNTPKSSGFHIRKRKKLYTGKQCPRCKHDLYISDVPGYRYQCFHCDEDFYECEV